MNKHQWIVFALASSAFFGSLFSFFFVQGWIQKADIFDVIFVFLTVCAADLPIYYWIKGNPEKVNNLFKQ